MSRIVLCPKKMGSESASELAKIFNTKKVFKNRKFRRRSTDLLVNWGNASLIPVFGDNYLNKPEAVENSSNKVKAFDILDEVGGNIPWYATSIEEARELFNQEGVEIVFCRTLTRASEGRGIVIAHSPEELVPAGLYTALEPHTNEYRVHIFDDRVIDVAEKRRASTPEGEEPVEPTEEERLIKNHHNGWVFARGNARLKHLDGEYKTAIAEEALLAIEALELDFGAVDVIYNNPTREAFVLEVNSAPGMEAGSTTLFNYANAFKRKHGLPELTLEEFNALYPDLEDNREYELVTNFINNL
jgi:glutathione synthase/RimK-type ligase-like ATP-grasp enzyme